jgi:hypothetical protein
MPQKPILTHRASRGDGDGDAVARAGAGCRRQTVGVGVAADDAVQDHDVRRRGLVWVFGVVGDLALDSILQAVLLDQGASGGFVAVDDLDVCGVACAGFEQFDLEAADATADLQHRAFGDADVGERLEDPSGGAGESFAAVAARVSFDGLSAEDGAVAGWCAAVHVPEGLVALMVAPRAPNFSAFWRVSSNAERA